MEKTANYRVVSIKSNPDEMNKFIEEYKPFIASCVQKCTGRYVEYGRDDELSIGMLAFHEAIQNFDDSKGHFFTFAGQVIQRRLIDYFRKQKKYTNETPLEIASRNDEDENFDISMLQSIKEYSRSELESIRKIELEELKKELSLWNLSFFDVAQASPRQNGTRTIYLEVVSHIVSDKSLIEHMMNKRYLPIAKICDALKVNRKKVERGRDFIIAAVLIMTGDYQCMKDFIDWR